MQGYDNRPDAQAAFEQNLPDLAIIDIGLQNEIDGGFSLCQSLRALSPTVPIIFLTARDSDFDTVCGLRMGADDYLTKDTSLPHLMARIAALFRRSDLLATPTEQETLIERGSLTIDKNKMQIFWNKELVELTVTEFWMVYALAKRPGHVKSRHDLMDEAQVVVDDSTITSHVNGSAKKIPAI